MRKTSYKRLIANETIRPKVIFDITKYLIENSILYKEESIRLNTNWLEDCSHVTEVDITDRQTEHISSSSRSATSDSTNNSMENTDTDTTKHTETDSDDDWEEVTPDETLSGNSDTLLQHNDFIDDGRHALKIAPGEQNHSVSLYLDEYAEEKSFPLLFGGQKHYTHPIKVSYATICKSELRNRDRRFATCVPNIFFK